MVITYEVIGMDPLVTFISVIPFPMHCTRKNKIIYVT